MLSNYNSSIIFVFKKPLFVVFQNKTRWGRINPWPNLNRVKSLDWNVPENQSASLQEKLAGVDMRFKISWIRARITVAITQEVLHLNFLHGTQEGFCKKQATITCPERKLFRICSYLCQSGPLVEFWMDRQQSNTQKWRGNLHSLHSIKRSV